MGKEHREPEASPGHLTEGFPVKVVKPGSVRKCVGGWSGGLLLRDLPGRR